MNSSIGIDKRYKEMRGLAFHRVSQQEVLSLIDEINQIEASLRQSEIEKLSEILIMELQWFHDWEKVKRDTDFSKKISECIEMMAVTEYSAKNAYKESLYFLRGLREKGGAEKTSDIVQSYWKFQDILPTIKGIFLLENTDGTKVYPVYELVIGLAQDFKKDNEHLVELAIALQLFEKISSYVEINEQKAVRKAILEIAQEHGIAFLEKLVNNGEIISCPQDYRYNGTLVVQCERDIIIRNIHREYFEGLVAEEDILSEERLAWYIVVKLAPDEETITLEEVFLKGTQNEKLTLLKLMEEEASYNLFSAPYIVRNSKDHRVLRLLNPAASHDKAIVCNNTKEENEKDGFLKMLRMGIQNLRGCWLFKDDCDVLTVDFYAAFYLEVVKNQWKFCVDLDNHKNQFYQECLMNRYLTETLQEASMEDAGMVVEKLYAFINQYFNFEQVDEHTLMNGDLLAFPWIGTVAEQIGKFYSEKHIRLQLWGESATQWKYTKAIFQSKSKKWEVDGRQVRKSDFLDLDLQKITEHGGNVPQRDIDVFVNSEDQSIVYYEDLRKSKGKVRFLEELVDEQVMRYDERQRYFGKNMKRMLRILVANRLKKEVFDCFQCRDETKEMVCLYKLCWHFQVFGITEEVIDSFWKLMLEEHYLGMVEDTDAINTYFEKMQQLAVEAGTLVIAKESSGNDSTLQYLFEEYKHNENSGRCVLSLAFDSGKVNKELKKAGNQILWRGSPLKKIVFMVDNLMHGSSLESLLKYHIRGMNNDRRDYLNLEIPVSQMLQEFPDLEIEVHVMFGFKDCVEKIQQAYSVNIVIHNEISSDFCSDKTTNDLVEKLYGESKPEGICCVFRYNNQPFKMVFPDYVCECNKRTGLFYRHNEEK